MDQRIRQSLSSPQVLEKMLKCKARAAFRSSETGIYGKSELFSCPTSSFCSIQAQSLLVFTCRRKRQKEEEEEEEEEKEKITKKINNYKEDRGNRGEDCQREKKEKSLGGKLE